MLKVEVPNICDFRVLLLLFFLGTWSFPDTLTAKETIQWLWYEQAPYFIGNDPSEGQGIGDQLTVLYQKNLPEYNHQNIRVNAERYKIMIQNDNVCVPVAWSSPGERKFLVHSRPYTLEPPAGIYIHRSKQHLFAKSRTRLSLKELLKKTHLKLGVLRGLEYSPEVDLLLKQNSDRKNVIFIDAPIIQINLKMLKLNRLDYLLGLPSQKTELKIKEVSDEYLFYNISEISNYIPIYTHCSNTKSGSKIIQKINGLLTDEFLVNSIDSFEYWYGENENFRNLFLDHIIHGISHPMITDM